MSRRNANPNANRTVRIWQIHSAITSSRRGVIGPEQLQEAETVSTSRKLKLQDAIVQLGYATSEQIMRCLAEQHDYDFIDLNNVPIPPAIVELVPESVARENAVIPFSEEDGKLKVVVSDPLDFETFDKLAFILNRKVDIALSTKEGITEAINRNYGQVDGESADSMLQEFTDTAIDFTETEEDGTGDEDDVVDETSAPIVRLVQLMITEAVQLRASDIHVEPFEDRVRIRYRIDGVLVERDSPPRRLLGALLSRIKILSSMDIAERRRTQDGRIKITAGGKELDLRVSMLPTNHGQSCVMRLLDKDNIRVGVRQLGLNERDFRIFRNLIKRPNGIFLVTGPTGSGKTTTLYAALNELNRPDRKIITAEDPVEYYLPGHQSGGSEAQHSARLRADHSRHASSGAERDSRRRDARPRDCFDGYSGIAHRSLGVQHLAHQRRPRCSDANGRHGRAGLPCGRQCDRHSGSASGPRRLHQVQTARPALRRAARICWHHSRAGGRVDLYAWCRLFTLRQERLSRSSGNFRADDDDFQGS